jgi:quinol monooxygenase YgiN
MIVRIVRLSLREDAVADFLALFEARKERIRGFEGCLHLELWQDLQQPNVCFTYSHWADESYLDKYRFSSFFKETWTLTKALFAEQATAWSVVQKAVLP